MVFQYLLLSSTNDENFSVALDGVFVNIGSAGVVVVAAFSVTNIVALD